MKPTTTIYLGENKIEFFNSTIGKETVKVNNEEVSSKSAFNGADHIFRIFEDEKEIECKLSTGYALSGYAINLYKGGRPVIKSPISHYVGASLIIMVVFLLIPAALTLLHDVIAAIF